MKKFLKVVCAVGLLSPTLAFAAFNDVTLTTSAVIRVGGNDYAVSGSNALLQSISVNPGNFSITVAPGSSLTVTSSNQSDFTVTVDPLISSSVSCPNANSTLTLTASGTTTVTITPSGTCTIPGSGGGGGGGGGSAYPPPAPPSPSPAPVTVATTSVQTTQTSLPQGTTTPLITSTTTVLVNGPTLTKTLELGSTDHEVIDLQQFLIAKGMLVLPTTIPQGYFGTLTETAVKKFQESVGLSPLGIVGPMTRDAIAKSTVTKYLNSAIPKGFVFTRSLKIGSSGDDVSALQQILIAKGFLIFNARSTPGYFGGVTRNALMNFQQSIGLERVGTVGPRTRSALNAMTQ